MPRKSRIDAPEAIHHIIARGIERRRIFGHQYCGHSILMAQRKNDWQDTDKVMGMFGENFVESVLKLKLSVPAVSKSAIRGEKLAKDRKYSLVGKLKLKS